MCADFSRKCNEHKDWPKIRQVGCTIKCVESKANQQSRTRLMDFRSRLIKMAISGVKFQTSFKTNSGTATATTTTTPISWLILSAKTPGRYHVPEWDI